ncbi:MAG: NRDE family protein [Burkholderiales bacterium]|nr:NRDE family protein [Burkholderiales bacterium]
MCLVVLAYRPDERHELVVAANRDEWFKRATAPAGFWKDHPDVFAGRDLEQGGTWLGVSRRGRFAALTNFRDPPAHRPGAPSRGALVAEFLTADGAALACLSDLRGRADRYNGFGLLAWDGSSLAFLSSRNGGVTVLEPGLYGLSNHLLDTPWPKVREGKRRLAETIAHPFGALDLLTLLDSTEAAPDAELPDTGVGRDWERKLSPMRIVAGDYGTRSSTALVVTRAGDVEVAERTFDREGAPTETVFERFRIERPARARAPSRRAGFPLP